MSLPSRAAAIRGDDYQHAIGWYWTCEMLGDPDIVSVSIEDRSGGSFDDIVVRRRTGATTYIQVKSSNYGNTIIDLDWLTTATTPNGRSPLQHFVATYSDFVATGGNFTLEVWTNRGFDHQSRLLGELLDQKFDTVDTSRLLAASPGSDIGKERHRLVDHLAVDPETLGAFLDAVRWRATGAEDEWRGRAVPLMKLAGLRSDPQAVDVGISMVRSWVTDGAGPQSLADVRAAVAERDLLAVSGTLVLMVHGIDHDPPTRAPTVTLDFVDLYEGEDPFERKLLTDTDEWDATVAPNLREAAQVLEAYRVRNVHVEGSLRHPMWFAVGRSLPEVKKWTLSLDQVGGVWRTDEAPEQVEARMLSDQFVGAGSDLAIGLGLTADPSSDIATFVESAPLPVGRILVFGPQDPPSPTSVPSGAWAMSWSRSVRDQARAAAGDAGRIHIFLLCPAGVALMLGHQWNLMPATTIYEFAGGTYHPTLTAPGS